MKVVVLREMTKMLVVVVVVVTKAMVAEKIRLPENNHNGTYKGLCSSLL